MKHKNQVFDNVLDLVGKTPLIKLNKMAAEFEGNFYAKVESFNPGHSSKDRIALYIIEEAAPNAFATGRDKHHAVVAVTTGLLGVLNKRELEGVIAHELSHIGNNDMLVSTVAVVLVGMITIASDMLLRGSMFGGRDSEGKGNAVILILGLVLALLMPLIGKLFQLAISRKRELLADATGSMLTRYPEGLATALEKIHAHGSKMKSANHATAHLFIANPFGLKRAATYVNKLFLTHPPVEVRTQLLREMDNIKNEKTTQ